MVKGDTLSEASQSLYNYRFYYTQILLLVILIITVINMVVGIKTHIPHGILYGLSLIFWRGHRHHHNHHHGLSEKYYYRCENYSGNHGGILTHKSSCHTFQIDFGPDSNQNISMILFKWLQISPAKKATWKTNMHLVVFKIHF